MFSFSSSNPPQRSADVEYENFKLFQEKSNRARESLRKAVEADEKKTNKRSIAILYRSAARDLSSALLIPPNSCPPNKRADIRLQHEKLQNFLESVQERLAKLDDGEEKRRCQSSSSTSRAISSARTASNEIAVLCSSGPPQLSKAQFLRGVNAKFGEEILSTAVLDDTAKIRLSDVEGNGAAKEALEESVILPSLNPKLFTGLRAPCKGILLFGPPGNGKTMLAKAVASECRSTFFNVSAATIMSKWVGDGEKMVQALFQVARNAQPSIIFIDEVDSMLCERSEQENGAARRVKTEFLIQMDGCANKSEDRVLILAATNRPHELDEGILRRFPKRIFIDLPEKNARGLMIRSMFRGSSTKAALSNKDLDYLANRTKGYSYSDLDALCRSAALVPIRSVDRSNVHKITEAHLRPVDVQDFEEALLTVRPSLNSENRQKLLDFAKKHAQITAE